jgi:group I intron endonuclease
LHFVEAKCNIGKGSFDGCKIAPLLYSLGYKGGAIFMSEIYVIKNRQNAMVYVGSTSITAERRFIEHKSAARLGNIAYPLLDAINSLGEENFYYEIIEVCDEDVIWERESFWMSDLGAISDGYNKNSQDTSILVYSLDGYVIDEVVSGREFARNYGFDQKTVRLALDGLQHRIGKYLLIKKSELTAELLASKVAEVASSKHSNTGRPFTAYLNGLVVGEFSSKTECAKELGLISQKIGPVLNGNMKSHKGYTFRYTD